jgi:hypothetical protein
VAVTTIGNPLGEVRDLHLCDRCNRGVVTERAALIDVARAADKVKGVRLETVTYVRLRAALDKLPEGVLDE